MLYPLSYEGIGAILPIVTLLHPRVGRTNF